jgi:hypothetical protein
MPTVERIYYIAECIRCSVKVSFRAKDEREEWMREHDRQHVSTERVPPMYACYLQPRGE